MGTKGRRMLPHLAGQPSSWVGSSRPRLNVGSTFRFPPRRGGSSYVHGQFGLWAAWGHGEQGGKNLLLPFCWLGQRVWELSVNIRAGLLSWTGRGSRCVCSDSGHVQTGGGPDHHGHHHPLWASARRLCPEGICSPLSSSMRLAAHVALPGLSASLECVIIFETCFFCNRKIFSKNSRGKQKATKNHHGVWIDIHRADLESTGDLECGLTHCPQADPQPVPLLQWDAAGGAQLEAVGLEEELAAVQGGHRTLTLNGRQICGPLSPRPLDGSVVSFGWPSCSWGPGVR